MSVSLENQCLSVYIKIMTFSKYTTGNRFCQRKNMLFDFAGFAEKAQVAEPEMFVKKCEELRRFLEEVNKEVNLTPLNRFKAYFILLIISFSTSII